MNIVQKNYIPSLYYKKLLLLYLSYLHTTAMI